MELVYLWVKDYKNIHHQGFNFSPRFTCRYDKVKQELTIDKKDDYVSIFPPNINVTAIVGENGSGKSGIIQFFENIFFDQEIKKYIFVSYINKEMLIYSNLTLIKILTVYEYILNPINNISLCSYNAELPYPYEHRKYLHDKKEFYTINLQEKYIYKLMSSIIKTGNNDIVNIVSDIFKPTKMIVSENIEYKDYMQKELKSLLNEDLTFKNIIIDMSIQENLEYKKFILIDKLIDEVYEGEYDNFLESEAEKDFEKNKESYRGNSLVNDRQASDEEILEFLSDEIFKKNPPEQYIRDILDKTKLYQFFMQQLNQELYSHFTLSSFNTKQNIGVYKVYIFYKILKENLLQKFLQFIISTYFNDLNNTTIDSIEQLIKEIFDESNIQHTEEFLKENNNYSITFDEFKNLKFEINNFSNDKYFNDYYELFSFEFFDQKGKKFSDLSHGEKIFYGQVLNIYFYIKQNDIQNNFMFCFDEPELSLHPMWQKEYLNKFINFITNLGKNIHFVFSSHSPFLLSDLPQENIIFLKKDKNGNCENVTKETNIETFGANIHTLLSHGFFMKDGLMGEFAKGKIEEIKKFYDFNQKFKSRINAKEKIKERVKKYYLNKKEKFNHIQSIIGEPFLKTIMKNYLDELELIFSDDEDLINKELKELEKRKLYLEKLKNAKN
ncbi:MAG: AAA family ATPase [Sulfurimonas sp.]|jgi:predicted ATPase|uniref:AAA family ATPase n=1 Tax=Sulfurimonas sp. TaxID=2022749 RepID=UPI0035616DCF